MKEQRLVCIDTRTNTHSVYACKSGEQGTRRTRIQTNEFTRVLMADECEEYRTDPKRFLASVETVESAEVSNG